MPYCPRDDREGDTVVYYDTFTTSEKLVKDYTGLNFIQIEELPIDEYLFLVREAFIYKHSQTEEGREYLEECWYLEQTEPDREGLRERFGKKRR